MKFTSYVPLVSFVQNSVTSDGSSGKLKINIDDDFSTAAITSIKFEVCGNAWAPFLVNQNRMMVTLRDVTNSTDITTLTFNSSIGGNADGPGICQTSADISGDFLTEGEIELQVNTTAVASSGQVFNAHLLIELDGVVTKFVVWEAMGPSKSYSGTTYSGDNDGDLLYTSANWDTKVTTYLATINMPLGATNVKSRAWDGTAGHGEVTSTSSTPEYKESSAITPVDGRDYKSQGKRTGFSGDVDVALPCLKHKFTAAPTKFQIINPLQNSYRLERDGRDAASQFRSSFDPGTYGDMTRVHYFEGVVQEAGDGGRVNLTEFGINGVGQGATALTWTGVTAYTRLRSSSFAEPAANPVGWNSEFDASFLDTNVHRQIILVTSATNPGTNMQMNIGNAWVTIIAVWINIGDTWKVVPLMLINIGDTWKVIF